MIFFLPVSLILIGYFFSTLFYILKNRKIKIEQHLFINELIISLLFLVSAIIFPFIYSFHSPDLSQNSLNFLWLTTSIFLLFELSVWFYVLVSNAIRSKRVPELMVKKDYKKFCETFLVNWNDDIKNEIGRKLLHLLTVIIVFFFWTLGVILDDIGMLDKWGLDIYSFSLWLIITIAYGFVIMFQIADLARLNRFYMLPNWAIKWFMNMKESELNTFISSTAMVLALIPFVFAPFPILASVALITTGADAVACLIGKKFGNHKLKKNSKKTIEGFISGGISTLIIVLIICILYNPWMEIRFEKIILMSIVATILFLFVDYISVNISDNILNPIICGLGMWIIFII